MKRYTLLFLTLALSYPAFAQVPPPSGSNPTVSPKYTFVIVHGAWAGGWEWKRCGTALEAAGHKVHRPTLSGQGERVHLASRFSVDLATHIQDIVNFIVWEDLHDIVLVGHSYGGMVITGVIDQVPDRIRHAIYLDAIVPEAGENAFEAINPGKPPMKDVDGFIPLGNMKTPPRPPHVVPMPVNTFTQPISLKNQENARKVPTTYILTADDARAPEKDAFFRAYERARARNWNTVIMEGDHVVHLTRTQELAKLLEQAP